MVHLSKKINLINFLAVAIIVLFAFFGTSVFAAGPIVPCGPGLANDTCETCDLFRLVQNIVNFIMLMAPVLGSGMIAVGAFYMISSGGSSSRIEEGKGIIWNAVLGFLIILSAWLIVDTVLVNLASEYGSTGGLYPWNNIQCN